MTIIAILSVSVLLQLAASVMALRLVRASGRHLAWILIAVALALMAARRSITLYELVVTYAATGGDGSHGLDLTAELVALAISAIMLVGMLLVGPIFAECQRVEGALRESEAKYRGILENSIDTFYRTDTEGRIVLASRSATELLGYPIDELIGRDLAGLYADSKGREAFLKALEARGGRVTSYDTPLRHKDGRVVMVATSASYLRDGQGGVIGVEGIARDITDQKRAEALNTRLGRIVEDSVNEIYVFDSETLRFLMVNRGARENLGYSLAELREMTPVDIKPEFDAESFAGIVAPLRSGAQQVADFETAHRRKDGTTYDIEVRLQLSRSEDPPVFFAIIVDVTERRRTEEALRQAQKMEAVGQLTGGIAHDFNNLLAVVLGNLELGREELEDGTELTEQVDRAIAASKRGSALTARLLAFSRRQTLRPKVVNLDQIISGMSELLGRTLGERIDIRIVPDEELWSCEVDPSQMENSLLNLAINARDAMRDGGTLTFTACNLELEQDAAKEKGLAPGQYVRIAVADTGAGMTAETIAHAFEPFFTTKGLREGSGLGLSMVHGFVKQSRGNVELRSREGLGTTVEILLPRCEKSIEGTDRTQGRAEPAGQGKTVLVVEDDEEVRALVVAMLERLGFRCLVADSGTAAIGLLEQETAIDTLVTDVVLPGGMNGFETAEQFRRFNPALKVLFMSGYAPDQMFPQAGFEPEVDLLQKPFSQEALADKLGSLAAGDAPLERQAS